MIISEQIETHKRASNHYYYPKLVKSREEIAAFLKKQSGAPVKGTSERTLLIPPYFCQYCTVCDFPGKADNDYPTPQNVSYERPKTLKTHIGRAPGNLENYAFRQEPTEHIEQVIDMNCQIAGTYCRLSRQTLGRKIDIDFIKYRYCSPFDTVHLVRPNSECNSKRYDSVCRPPPESARNSTIQVLREFTGTTLQLLANFFRLLRNFRLTTFGFCGTPRDILRRFSKTSYKNDYFKQKNNKET